MAQTPVGPGTLLAGRFTLEDLLEDAEGARFWRATDQILARNVGVHVISAEDPRSAALLNAARTSATVSDGHLLRVLDAATEDGITYVVNEWGHGISLDRLLEEGPLSGRRAAWVVKEVAEAISTAHRHGIAHGRLLPENVMVTEAGSVKLIGFVVDAVLRGREHTQVTGGRALAEHEADVVNLGALLYAALTGRWAGTDGSSLPLAPTDHGRALRPRQVRAGVPRPLDAICERVLNADPTGPVTPLETAHEIYAALCDYIGDPSGATPVGFEATTMFGEDDLARLRAADEDTPGTSPEAETALESTGELEATQAGAPPLGDDTAAWSPDPDPTQVGGAPVPPAPVPPASVPPVAGPRLTVSNPVEEDFGDGGEDWDPSGARPLFAPGPPRRTVEDEKPEARPRHRSPGPRNGTLPPTWGPDPGGEEPAEDSVWDTSSWEDGDAPGRSWLRLALTLGGIVVLVVAIIIAFQLGRGSGGSPTAGGQSPSPSASSAAAGPIKIASVSDFDPQGDPPEENPQSAPLAIDGNPQTAWRTSTYYDPLNLLKNGVGLVVDLGKPHEVSKVQVTFIGSPTSFEVLAAPQGAGKPTSTDGLERVARQQDAGTQADVTLAKPVTTRYLVVWLTSLPQVSGGFRGQVAEIRVR